MTPIPSVIPLSYWASEQHCHWMQDPTTLLWCRETFMDLSTPDGLPRPLPRITGRIVGIMVLRPQKRRPCYARRAFWQKVGDEGLVTLPPDAIDPRGVRAGRPGRPTWRCSGFSPTYRDSCPKCGQQMEVVRCDDGSPLLMCECSYFEEPV